MVLAHSENPFAKSDGDENVDAFWSALVRLPTQTLAPWRQYASTSMDPRFYWVNDDAQLALAESWSPCSYAGGFDFDHVTEIPCLTLALDVEEDVDPRAFARLVDRHRARLKIPPAHFQVFDPAAEQLHLIWNIRPLHKPPKGAAGQNHYAWSRIRSSWRMAQLKLALAFELLGAKPTPAIFTPKLPLPHPAHRRSHLGLEAEILDGSPALPPYYVRDVSAPIDKTEYERRAFKVLRPARRLPGFLAGAKAWVQSEVFQKAAEPKTEGGRHPAAVTLACCLRWSGCEAPAIEKFLREWSATHIFQGGFPSVRGRGDEITLLTEWAVKNLVPGGPRREAKVRGNYAQKATTLAALAAFLMEQEAHVHPWVGTQRDLIQGAKQLSGTKVSLRTLQALLPELRAAFGLVTTVERVGKTWTTEWRLREALEPSTISEAFGEQRGADDSLFELFNAPLVANSNIEPPRAASQPSLFLASTSHRKKSLGPTRSDRALSEGESSNSEFDKTLQPETSFVSLKPSPIASLPSLATSFDLQFLHSLGLSLIPLKPKSKVSRGRWGAAQKRRPSLSDLEVAFAAHPNSNLAVVTGELSGVVVVDIDSDEALSWAKSHLPETRIRTVSSPGREHWYYRHPGQRVSNRGTVQGREDVQIRGDGGYVLAPGAVHPDGHTYAVGEPWTRETWESTPTFDFAWVRADSKPDYSAVDGPESFFGVFRKRRPKAGDE